MKYVWGEVSALGRIVLALLIMLFAVALLVHCEIEATTPEPIEVNLTLEVAVTGTGVASECADAVAWLQDSNIPSLCTGTETSTRCEVQVSPSCTIVVQRQGLDWCLDLSECEQ